MRRRALVLGGTVVLMASAVGVAIAFFSVLGSGSGSAQTRATLTSITLTPGSAPSTLYPSGTGTVTTTATNPGDVAVRIPALQLDTTQGTSGFAVDAAHTICPLSSLSFPSQTTGWTVPANGSLVITMSSSLAMSATAPDACQGAAFRVYLKVAT